MKQIKLIIFLVFAFINFANAQIYGEQLVCPNQTIRYDADVLNGEITWSIFNGTITSKSSGNNLKFVDVKWDNTSNIGKLTVRVSDGKNIIDSESIDVKIKSVNGYDPKPIFASKGSVSQTINTESTGRVLYIDWCEIGIYTFTTTRDNFPNTSEPIDGFIWEVPAGWQVTSTQVQPIGANRYATYDNFIHVRPIAGDGGRTSNQVKVQAFSRYCDTYFYSPAPFSYVSNPQVLYINREPKLNPIRVNNSTAPLTLNCGDLRPLTLSVNSMQL
jgi:hypothetical protein